MGVVRRALAGRPRPTVPCNNDLLAANYIDDGDRVWLIDYEYSGNNEATFELGNTATECDFTPEQVEAWTAAYFGAPTRGDLARVRLRALCSAYGWSLWGFIQAASSPLDFDFHSWGHGALREGGGRLPRAGLRRASRGLSPRDGAPHARSGRRRRWRHHRLLGGLPPGEAGLDRRAAAGAGHLSGGSTWHAAGLVGPLRATESGTQLVQYSAELYAALEAETGMATGYRGVGGVIVARTEDRMVQLRRTAANAVAYDMECELVGPARPRSCGRPCGSTTCSGPSGCPATAR